MNATLETLDWIVLGGYFAILLGIAWWVILQKNKTSEDYFLAGRNTHPSNNTIHACNS